ncbi:MAG: hypothetical protein KDA25_04585 [Phycisphaerales bacterium]|nr:hypothetical protein [Phycisphaerales bacterium]
MRWSVFIVFAFVAFVFDVSLAGLFAVGRDAAFEPSIIACLAVFIALFASRMSALWACWILGMLVDLSHGVGLPDATTIRILGPHALGFVIAGYMLLQVRTMVFRRRALTFVVLTFSFLVLAHVAAVAIAALRSWLPGTEAVWAGHRPVDELFRRFFLAAYSAVVAFPVGWALVRTVPAWGFQSGAARSANWR